LCAGCGSRSRRVAVVEEPHPQEIEDEEPPLLPAFAQPDEARWWELQLGFALPSGLYTETATGP
jgi:hypothetical protein